MPSTQLSRKRQFEKFRRISAKALWGEVNDRSAKASFPIARDPAAIPK
jgi:hypothetical protein